MWLDESGLLMAPLVRRSWAPVGQPPVLRPKAGHRQKVSVAGALWLTPGQDRVGLAYQTVVDGYFSNGTVADFVSGAVPGLGCPVILIWDGGTMHKGGPINDLVAGSGGRLELAPLPPYAPELMPVEQVWGWLKYGQLCNYTPASSTQLDAAIRAKLDPIRADQELLRGFIHASALPLPRALLS
jgi:hypothetical protein